MCEKCAATDRKVLGSLNRLHEKVDKQHDEQIAIKTKIEHLQKTDNDLADDVKKHDIVLFGAGPDKPGILTILAKTTSVTDNLSKVSIALVTMVLGAIVMYFFKG